MRSVRRTTRKTVTTVDNTGRNNSNTDNNTPNQNINNPSESQASDTSADASSDTAGANKSEDEENTGGSVDKSSGDNNSPSDNDSSSDNDDSDSSDDEQDDDKDSESDEDNKDESEKDDKDSDDKDDDEESDKDKDESDEDDKESENNDENTESDENSENNEDTDAESGDKSDKSDNPDENQKAENTEKKSPEKSEADKNKKSDENKDKKSEDKNAESNKSDKKDDKNDKKDKDDADSDSKKGNNGVANNADDEKGKGNNGVANSANEKKKKKRGLLQRLAQVKQAIVAALLALKAMIAAMIAALLAKLLAFLQALFNAIMQALMQAFAAFVAFVTAVAQVALVVGLTLAFGFVGLLIGLVIVVAVNGGLSSLYEGYTPYVYHECFDEYDSAYRGLFGSLDSNEAGNSGAAKYIQNWDEKRKNDEDYEEYLRNMLGTAQKVRSFFRTYGLTDTQCAAVCGYLYHAGGLDPTFVEPVDTNENAYDKQWFKSPLESDAKQWINSKDYKTSDMIADSGSYPMTSVNPDTISLSDINIDGLERVGIGIGKWRDYKGSDNNTKLREFATEINDQTQKVNKAIKDGMTWQSDLRAEQQNRWNVIYGGSNADLGEDDKYSKDNYKSGTKDDYKQYYIIGEPDVKNQYRTYVDEDIDLPWVDGTGYNNSSKMPDGEDGESLEYLVQESSAKLAEKYKNYNDKCNEFGTLLQNYYDAASVLSSMDSNTHALYATFDMTPITNLVNSFNTASDLTYEDVTISHGYAYDINSPVKWTKVTTNPYFNLDNIEYIVPNAKVRNCTDSYVEYSSEYNAMCQTMWFTLYGYKEYICKIGDNIGWNGYSDNAGFNSSDYSAVRVGSLDNNNSLYDVINNSQNGCFNAVQSYITLRGYETAVNTDRKYDAVIQIDNGSSSIKNDVNNSASECYNIIDNYRYVTFYNGWFHGDDVTNKSIDDQYFGWIPRTFIGHTNSEVNMSSYWKASDVSTEDMGADDSRHVWDVGFTASIFKSAGEQAYYRNDDDYNYFAPYDWTAVRAGDVNDECIGFWYKYAITDRHDTWWCVYPEHNCKQNYANNIKSNWGNELMWVNINDDVYKNDRYYLSFPSRPGDNYGVSCDGPRVLKPFNKKMQDLLNDGDDYAKKVQDAMTEFNEKLNKYGEAYDKLVAYKNDELQPALDAYKAAIDDYNTKAELKAEALVDYYDADEDRYQANKRYIEDEVRDMTGGNIGEYYTKYAQQYMTDKYFAKVWGDYNGNMFPLWKKYVFHKEPAEDGQYLHWWDIDVQLLFMVSNPDFAKRLEMWDGNDARDMKNNVRYLETIFDTNVPASEVKNTAYAFYYLFQYGSPYAMNLRNGDKKNAVDDILETWTNIGEYGLDDGSFKNYVNHDYYDEDGLNPVIWNPYGIDNSYGYSLLQAADMTYQRSKVNTMGMLANTCQYIDTIDNSSFAKASLLLINPNSTNTDRHEEASDLYFWVCREMYDIKAKGGAYFPFPDQPVERQQELLWEETVSQQEVKYAGKTYKAYEAYHQWFGSAARWLATAVTWSGVDSNLFPENNAYSTIVLDKDAKEFADWFRWYVDVNSKSVNENTDFSKKAPDENGNLRQDNTKDEEINGTIVNREYLKDKYDKDKKPNGSVDNRDENKWARINIDFTQDNWQDIIREGDILIHDNNVMFFIWYGSRLVSDVYPDITPQVQQLDENGNPVVDSNGNPVMITDESDPYVAGHLIDSGYKPPCLAHMSYFKEKVLDHPDDWSVYRLVNPENNTTCRNMGWDYMTRMQYSEEDLDKVRNGN